MEKPILKFKNKDNFRILMVSDFHLGKNNVQNYNHKVTEGLEALIKETNPDFVMIGGDQCIDVNTLSDAVEYFSEIIKPIIDRQIPWGAVFGNHDNEMGLSVEDEEKAYELIPGCVNEAGPQDIDGTGNYCVKILSEDESETLFAIYALDSHREIEDFREMFNIDSDAKFILPEHFNEGSGNAAPTFEQAMWYYNTSKKLEKAEGKKIPAVMFMHIPLVEYLEITRNPEETGAIGNKRETLGCCEFNFGTFGACLQRGDVKGIFFGHEHLCDIQGKYCGITMAQDAALGYNMSCHDDLRGGRVIDLFKDGSIQTHCVKLIDIMGLDAMRRPDYFEGGCKYFIRKL